MTSNGGIDNALVQRFYMAYIVSFLGAPHDHVGLFIDTDPDGSGRTFEVKGNIQTGMEHVFDATGKPEDRVGFIKKEPVGKISASDFARVEAICEGVAPPAKQYDGPKRINYSVPLRRCGEWTDEAVKALRDAGVVSTMDLNEDRDYVLL